MKDEYEAWVAARLNYMMVKEAQQYLGQKRPDAVRRARMSVKKTSKDFKKALDEAGIDYKERHEKDS